MGPIHSLALEEYRQVRFWMQQGEWPQGLKVDFDHYLRCRHLQAAAQGDLQALQTAWQQAGHSWQAQAWLQGAGQPPEPSDPLDETWAGRLCAAAAAGGRLALLQWLHQNGCCWDQSTCSGAARRGHLAVLQWARQNGCGWDEGTCANAAAGGHLAVLEWTRQGGCRWDERTCSCAAQGGHLAVLQWARQNGCNWDEFTCLSAARGGHLAVLQWARQHGCSWDENTCTFAAAGGHLAVLQWARQNGCSWSEHTCAHAAGKGHLAVLEWACQSGCPWSGLTILRAAASNKLDILKWAQQQQPCCPWWSLDELDNEEECDLIDAEPSTLLWLAQQGAPLPDEAHATACSSADRLTHAYLALRALLPAEVLMYVLKLSLE